MTVAVLEKRGVNGHQPQGWHCPKCGHIHLSERQRDIIRLVADGLDSAAIGGKLHIAEQTVKWHLRQLSAQLNARNRAHLVSIAHQLGVLP